MINSYVQAHALLTKAEALMILSGDTLVLALLADALATIGDHIDSPDAQAA